MGQGVFEAVVDLGGASAPGGALGEPVRGVLGVAGEALELIGAVEDAGGGDCGRRGRCCW